MPTPTATLNWSGDAGSKSANNTLVVETRSQTWLVRDAATLDDVYAALNLPRFNDPYAPTGPNSVYKVKAITPQRKSPSTWEARIDYGIPPLGDYPTQQVDQLQQPAVIRFEPNFTQRPMPIDVDGYQVYNSAGDPFDPPPTENRTTETMTVSKWFPSYDRAMARAFRNTYNADAFTLGNTLYLPGEILCERIYPDSEMQLTTLAQNAHIVFQFSLDNESRPPPASSTAAPSSGFPFDAHLIDQGRLGWFKIGSAAAQRGRFCSVNIDTSGNKTVGELLDNVLLDGTGKPIDANIKIAQALPGGVSAVQEPMSNPHTDYWMYVADHISPFDKPTLRQWRWHRARPADFTRLPL